MLERPADLLLVNGRLFTGGDPRQAAAFPAWSREGQPPEDAPNAIAINGGRIAWLGGAAGAARWRESSTEMLDARGGLIVPGFEDAHLHLFMGALSLAQADLQGAASSVDLAGLLEAWRATHPDAPWVIGRGWQYGLFPGGLPDRGLLDELVPDRPAVLESFDGHTHWLNSRALAAAGITAAAADPAHGTIERDPGSGEPTGILKEFADELLAGVLPVPTEAEMTGLLRRAIGDARARGVTAVQEAWTEPADLRRYALMRDAGALGIRLRVALLADATDWSDGPEHGRAAWQERLHAYDAELAAARPDAWLQGGIVKAFADGVIESGTAWMLAPYDGTAADTDGAFGRPNWTSADLAAMTAIAARAGWQVEIHAIGDGAIRAALEAHEQANGVRGRVEHVEWPDPPDVPRFGRLGVIASMQPTHALPIPIKEATRERAIGRRIAHRWPWASILRSGGVVAMGSDWPIATLDPLAQIGAAVGSDVGERLSLTEALACATWGSAFAARAEDRRGSISVGRVADLVVLDRDLLAEGASAIADTSVSATIVGGRVVYRAA